ncbi:hypothetical protein IRJ41_010525 [Triplophysa rosa]|uniref:Uncharacterized protein n=1 Tax=Triplophysa rosa TaxID=992332 RepID=A0A9W7TT87_TRIRA|nr:hypothetical protein IRJ41_010525 [Triplophysa rosa]
MAVSVLIQVHSTPLLGSKLLGQLKLYAASQANAKTNLIIISSNPAHYRLPNYPINSTSWESLFATQANVSDCCTPPVQQDFILEIVEAESNYLTNSFPSPDPSEMGLQKARSWKHMKD